MKVYTTTNTIIEQYLELEEIEQMLLSQIPKHVPRDCISVRWDECSQGGINGVTITTTKTTRE